MKTQLITYVALASTTMCLKAATVSVSTENIRHSDNTTQVANGQLALLVISTADAVFGSVKAGTISINNNTSGSEFIDDRDDAVFVAFATSTKAFSGGVRQAATSQSISVGSKFSMGARFALYWFPTVAFNPDLSTITLTAGTEYGISSTGTIGTGTTIEDWTLPNDSDALNYNQANAGAATFRVVAVVPEPTSTALLGLGGLSLLMRRRRA